MLTELRCQTCGGVMVTRRVPRHSILRRYIGWILFLLGSGVTTLFVLGGGWFLSIPFVLLAGLGLAIGGGMRKVWCCSRCGCTLERL